MKNILFFILCLLMNVQALWAGQGVLVNGLWYRSAESVLDVHSYVWWPDRQVIAGRINNKPVRFVVGSRTFLGEGLYQLLPGPVLVYNDLPMLPQELPSVDALEGLPVWDPQPWSDSFFVPPVSARTSILAYPLRIYVDPGHGGEDSGAVGINGIAEKEIVLNIARAIVRELGTNPSISLRMSRDKDTYPTLLERTRDASRWGADLFVSIHCNSAPRKSASGVEVYVVGNISSDRQAQRVVAYENRYVEQIADAPGGKVGMILADLSQNDTAQRSLAVASRILQQVMPIWGGENRGVRQAPFWVLRNATMPSLLVEVGFISNKKEADRLSHSGIQNSYGKLLAKAILQSADLLVNGVADVSR